MSLFRKIKKKQVDGQQLLKDYRQKTQGKKSLTTSRDTKALRRIFEVRALELFPNNLGGRLSCCTFSSPFSFLFCDFFVYKKWELVYFLRLNFWISDLPRWLFRFQMSLDLLIPNGPFRLMTKSTLESLKEMSLSAMSRICCRCLAFKSQFGCEKQRTINIRSDNVRC
jgi:hypothetical protein